MTNWPPARPTAIEAYEMVFAFRQKMYIEKMGFSGAGNMAVPVAGVSGPRHAKWRRMEVAVALRNFL